MEEDYFGASKKQIRKWLNSRTNAKDKNGNWNNKLPTYNDWADLWNLVHPKNKTTGTALRSAQYRLTKDN